MLLLDHRAKRGEFLLRIRARLASVGAPKDVSYPTPLACFPFEITVFDQRVVESSPAAPARTPLNAEALSVNMRG